MAKRKRAKVTLGGLIGADRAVLQVLDKHGITFCAGCYLTLSSPPEKAAVYHAVPDVDAFMKDLARALKKSAGTRRSRARA
jgi:hypothetical protein